MAEIGEWQPMEGGLPATKVIVPDAIMACTASRMCCPEHGVTQVGMLEINGTILGLPVECGIEFETKAQVEAVAHALTELANRMAS